MNKIEYKKTKYINNMTDLLCDKNPSFTKDDVYDIISAFSKFIERKLLFKQSVKIKNFGEFTIKTKNKMITKNFKGEPREKPEMLIPYFKTDRKLRNFINREE